MSAQSEKSLGAREAETLLPESNPLPARVTSHRLYRRRYQTAYNRQHPERRKAYKQIAALRERGLLLPEECLLCGRITEVTHHADYEYPEDVAPVCRACHTRLHRNPRMALSKIVEAFRQEGIRDRIESEELRSDDELYVTLARIVRGFEGRR